MLGMHAHTYVSHGISREITIPGVAGSWRESTVAIKAITHNATLSRKVDTLRESLVGISIQHPNVVGACSLPRFPTLPCTIFPGLLSSRTGAQRSIQDYAPWPFTLPPLHPAWRLLCLYISQHDRLITTMATLVHCCQR